MSNLWKNVYIARPDVQMKYQDIFNSKEQRKAFLRWCITDGKNEHCINDAFLEPVYRELGIKPENKKALKRGFREAVISPLYNFTVKVLVRIFGKGSVVIYRLSLIKQGLRYNQKMWK